MRILVHKLWVRGNGLHTFSDFIFFRMMFRAVMFMAPWLSIALLLTGCRVTDAHINWYSGPSRPTNEVGLVRFPQILGQGVIVIGVDGTDIKQGPGQKIDKAAWTSEIRQISLLPGRHVLEVGYFSMDTRSISNVVVGFHCESGHVYDLYMSEIQNNQSYPEKWDFPRRETVYVATWVIDEATGEVVAGQRFSKYFIISGGVTHLNAPDKTNRGSTTTFALQDMVRFYLTLVVNDPVQELPKRDVVFKLFAGSRLIADLSNEPYSYNLDGPITTIYLQRRAATLGVGHYRVQVLCEGAEIASQRFEITP